MDCLTTMINRKELTKYVSAFILGDGHLALSTGSRNAHYVLHQKAIHTDYVLWQADILETLTKIRVRYKDAYTNSQGAQAKPSIRIETMNHPFYTTLHQRWYNHRIKQISFHDLKLLDWEMLAIFYQDDGYIEVSERQTKSNYVRVRIATDCYTYGDLYLLTKAIKEKTNIGFDIVGRKLQHRQGYRLQTTKDMARRFIEGITPYVKESYRYKIDVETCTTHRTNVPEQSGDEIV